MGPSRFQLLGNSLSIKARTRWEKWGGAPYNWTTVPTVHEAKYSFNWARRHEGVLGEWKYSFTHSLTQALDGGEWSASHIGRFIPRERAHVTHWIGGCSVFHHSQKSVLATVCSSKNGRTGNVNETSFFMKGGEYLDQLSNTVSFTIYTAILVVPKNRWCWSCAPVIPFVWMFGNRKF